MSQSMLWWSVPKNEKIKKMRIAILFDMLLNPSFQITTSFANIARTAAGTSKLIY